MAERFLTYDWYIEGHPAAFTVDMAYEGCPPDPAFPVLVYVNALPHDPGLEAMKPGQRRALTPIFPTGEPQAGPSVRGGYSTE